MRYLSTRGGDPVSAAEAIVRGISPSGGLYVPEEYPKIDVADGVRGGYLATAHRVMKAYLSETESAGLERMIAEAYRRFDHADITPVKKLNEREHILELWHGPTMAFKDVALQMLPHLMCDSLRQTGETKQIYILVATSGDTGKAALEGFQDVAGTRVLVFYPEGGVSEAQRLQMVTQEGGNVDVCAVRGNFDDAQTGVKQIFASKETADILANEGYRLSSANSINFGRLLPQIVYYFTSYETLLSRGEIHSGEKINFCVPTGNFGDILAGEYARRMGLPIHRLICASNRNNVLTDFFEHGVYDENRPFYQSMSCSIDILISSNLERLLFELAGRDDSVVRDWMGALKEKGKYALPKASLDELKKTFSAGWCTEEDTLETIRRVFDEAGYLMDPHTAVAQCVYDRYWEKTGDNTKTVLLSTANPYKFASDVLGAFETAGEDDFENVDRLHALTKTDIPKGISGLVGKPEIHLDICDLEEMPKRVVKPVTNK
ncbi:Threonine synthase [bioreactor metagenome]|uniref:Threonine synthase n=1 Tax=bioreactor metagenome TaxID=1076179 RepID=A0A644YL24_9ZZZZ|nr:threonine synthase [Christensenella sp.]